MVQSVLDGFNGAKITDYSAAIKGLSLNQAQLLLSTQGLNAERSKEILIEAGLLASENAVQAELLESALIKAGIEKVERDEILRKLGLVTVLDGEAVAQGTCTAEDLKAVLAQRLKNAEDAEGIISSLGLAGANTTAATSFGLLTKAIWANIKAMVKWLFTTPAGLATVAAVAVGALIVYNKKLEESRQKMIESGKEAAQLTKDLDGLVEQYRKLGADGKFDNSDREQARNIQEQINELLGDEAHYIDLSNGGYEHQLELLRRLQYEQANAKYATLKDAKEAAEDSLLSKSIIAGAGTWETSDEKDAIANVMKKYGFENYMGENGYGEKVLSTFNVDTSSAEAAIKSYEDMIKLRDVLRQSYRKEIEKGGDLEDFYDSLNEKINDMSGAVQKYKDAINDYNINEAVVQFNETDFGGVKGALIDTKEQMELWVKAMVESDDISDGVKENLIGLAKTYYPDLSDAINESAQAHYKEKYATAKSSSEIGNHIKNLDAEADQCGLTKKAYIELISTEIVFNNKNLNVSQKISALQQLAYQAGITADKIRQALMFDSLQKAYDINTMGVERAYRNGLITEEERDFRKAQILSDLNSSLYEGYEDGSGGDVGGAGGGGGDGGSGSDNTPDHKDPTEAIINRINLRANELAQQEEYIQNALEIAEIEKDYEKQISLTNDLIANRKKRIEELNTANSGFHNEAEYLRSINPWDEASWFDGQGEATEAYYELYNNSSKEEQEKIKDLFEKLSKYKEAYIKNAEEIVDLNKEILQSEENVWDIRREIFDARLEESEYYIQHSNDFGWKNGDNEIEARKRVLDWIQSDYYRSLIKDDVEYYKILEENRLKYNDARKEEFTKGTDFGNTYLESQATLLQSYYDVTNSVAEAQHEINKELETSKTMYEYLDKDTRKLLFNQEDYNELSEELYDIQYKADKLQKQYDRDLKNSTLETIESITSNYQMQYETLMKSYEIAKADLEIAKKKQKLNNVLNERNVRMFINGQWQWVANTEDVANAKSELADAEYAKRVEEAGLTQQQSINNLTKQQDQLNVTIKKFENGVIDLSEAVKLAEEAIGSMPNALASMFNNTKPGTSSSSSSGSTIRTTNSNKTSYDSSVDYMANILGASSESEVRLNNASRNAKIQGDNRSENMMTDAEAIEVWKKAKGHASGTRYTPGGLTKMGENGDEFYIPANGRLIPINQPTVGNIQSGGVVFNSEQMKNLRTMWDMSNLKFTGSSNFAGSATPQQIDQSQDNRIIINGMTVDGGSADGQALISALRRYVGNH